MPRQDDLQLIKQSEIFKNLAPEIQKIIMKARGKDLQGYIKIFLKGNDALTAAKEEFMAENEEIVKTFTIKVKNVKREKRQNDEQNFKIRDEKTSEDLLKSMENITN